MSNTKKALALEALSAGLSVEKASEVSSVSRQSIYNWLAQADFQKELIEKQTEYFSRLSKRMTALTLKALDVLERSLESREESLRLRASSIVISSLNNILVMTNFEERISGLEKRQK